ncbi:sigma-54 interaction domain-containing protein [Sporohalobacter salinus]|uniref:sigma-54 interaction domain-containing protein n=1 Tax=Sporohalobacter salinus TaxID=1494606 RepID=UPI001EF87692|nr:sigma-54-dependent Fis family transcriptional regulator [Sporohalobacter salinus]MBM7622789.1 PAS domain S-box-containing protein [Sporohalobacter salinus]
MKQIAIINSGEDLIDLKSKLEEVAKIELVKEIDFSVISKGKLDFDLTTVDIILSTVAKKDLRKYDGINTEKVKVLGATSIELLQYFVEDSNMLQKYKHRQRQQEIIINAIHDAMIAINQTGRITIINEAAKKLLGRDKEYINKPVSEVVPNTRLDKVLQTGEKEINQQQSLGEKSIITNRVPVRDKEGNIIAAVAIFRDITEVEKLAEELTNLKEMRSMLEAIINSTQDAISVVDEKGKGILINPAYTKITGLTEEDVIGKPATVDIAEGESMHYKVLETKEPVSGVKMKVGPQKREVIVNVSPILVEGELKGSVGVIHDVSQLQELSSELSKTKKRLRQLHAKYTFEDIIANDSQMLAAINLAKRVATTPATVLLQGESGTGKELFAHAIHNDSKRSQKEFIRVNCAAIAESLLESELFGYEEGAFTGARKGGKKGYFEEADGGTIFLDEISKLNLDTQAKLLRVLQEKEITKVGGTEARSVDVRVIVATNADLKQAVEEGDFREDLYYRLHVVPIFIPPLRDRKEDIPELVDNLLNKYNQEYGRVVKDISQPALDRLLAYNWPGNVRELENVIGRAMINIELDDLEIQADNLPALEITETKSSTQVTKKVIDNELEVESKTLQELVDDTEKQAVTAALDRTDGNRVKAAKLLGISVRTLYYKLEKFNLK